MSQREPKDKGTSNLLDRRRFLKALGVGVAGGVLGGVSACRSAARTRAARTFRTKRLPNFVLILVDDLGWTDLGCMGSRYYETPNIDRLASEGMRFTDAYAACAVCSPTRAAVLTGRYPARTGITDVISPRDRGARMPEPGEQWPEYVSSPHGPLLCPRNPYWMEHDEITIAEALRPAGYTSCHVGKWHLGLEHWYPVYQGFDRNIGGCDYGYPGSYFDPYWHKNRSYIPTLIPRRTGEYLTDREVDEAVQFIRDSRDRPFFLYLAHYAVHTPIQAKEELIAKYEARPPTHQKNPTYAAMVQSVDDGVGRILKTLDELGLSDDTIIIFTSDNGGLSTYPEIQGPTNNAPLRAGKGFPYEGGIRVPLIIRWPGVVRPGSMCTVPVTSVDYFPTVLRAANLPLPTDRAIDGENLLPLLTEAGTLKRAAIYWHFPHYRPRWPAGLIVPYSSIRAGRWKLIRHYEGKPFELFNLKDDLGELNDLSEQMPEKVSDLDLKLANWLEDTGARLPRRDSNRSSGRVAWPPRAGANIGGRGRPDYESLKAPGRQW